MGRTASNRWSWGRLRRLGGRYPASSITWRTVLVDVLIPLRRSWFFTWLGPRPGCRCHSFRISWSRCASMLAGSGPDVGDGPLPSAARRTLRFQARMDQRLAPNFSCAFVGPCSASYSRITARCDGVYRFATRRLGSGGASGSDSDSPSSSATSDLCLAWYDQLDSVPLGIPNSRLAAVAPTSIALSVAFCF